jgi:hypothetical protein
MFKDTSKRHSTHTTANVPRPVDISSSYHKNIILDFASHEVDCIEDSVATL